MGIDALKQAARFLLYALSASVERGVYSFVSARWRRGGNEARCALYK